MEGKRTCVEFDPKQGEFNNVRTGDKIQIQVQLKSDQLSAQAITPLLQKILLSSKDRLADQGACILGKLHKEKSGSSR
jgi:hypothetical protein